MSTKTSNPSTDRARRFALHLPVYFRQPDSPIWLEGTTENISYTGVLVRSSVPLVPDTSLELRLQLALGAKLDQASEIRCKGSVVRVEQRHTPEASVALAVAIRDYRIVRRATFKENSMVLDKNTDLTPKARRH